MYMCVFLSFFFLRYGFDESKTCIGLDMLSCFLDILILCVQESQINERI